MRRLIAVSFAAAAATSIALGGSSAVSSLAKAGDAGSPGNVGLCNAYGHNNQHAKDNGQAFVRLAATAGDYNGDGTRDAQDVESYCADNVRVVGQPG